MKDYTKVCWNCGGINLQDMGDHVKCRECGATYNEVPKPGALPFTLEPWGGNYPPVRGAKAHSRPSGSVARKAAKAREKAKVK